LIDRIKTDKGELMLDGVLFGLLEECEADSLEESVALVYGRSSGDLGDVQVVLTMLGREPSAYLVVGGGYKHDAIVFYVVLPGEDTEEIGFLLFGFFDETLKCGCGLGEYEDLALGVGEREEDAFACFGFGVDAAACDGVYDVWWGAFAI
jgi:hypothetical protein